MKTYKTIKLPDGFSLKETTDDFVRLKYFDHVVANFNCLSVDPKEIKKEVKKIRKNSQN